MNVILFLSLLSYKVKQVKNFLRQLQQNIFVEIFNDSHYMQTLASKHQTIVEMDSLAGIRRVTIFKPSESKYLLARVVRMDDLFYYLYLSDYLICFREILLNMKG